MSERMRKWTCGTVAAIAAVLYAAVFSTPYEVAPNGTIEGQGMGRAIEMLVVGAVIYAALFFSWSRMAKSGGEAGE